MNELGTDWRIRAEKTKCAKGWSGLNFGLILFSEVFNLGWRLNGERLKWVELGGWKGWNILLARVAVVAALAFFLAVRLVAGGVRCLIWAFWGCEGGAVDNWRGEREKRRERGGKMGKWGRGREMEGENVGEWWVTWGVRVDFGEDLGRFSWGYVAAHGAHGEGVGVGAALWWWRMVFNGQMNGV